MNTNESNLVLEYLSGKRRGCSIFFSCSSTVSSQQQQQQQQGLNGIEIMMKEHQQQRLDLRLPMKETCQIFKSDGQVPVYFFRGFFLSGPPPRFVKEVATNKKGLKRGNNSCDKEEVHLLPKKVRKKYKDWM
ncbi:hypothetical protein Fcan01_24175 [Folsomia candida]|uniref:Uncharacterized protein n=1 Tax=Folsomia candida TaxID=158441 RepID=A0A226D5S5_FOLCA|nr:hypothetical protein Fcan01_24175 [Folsomia candida]